ncbi:DUF6514 family protein [Clostridium grantii]|uniref:Uncharacterized protein n=1 Tax=Clostridium grantii DSM 8605 TaxID=1121316 RepID=A0A1M5U4C7_9CLOT|nr:DUF6514 family protein [Clostridium grantii]SHH57798.1 hypothetical protein SAMN02745207_01570 [Clostridium grantii DSM 8605]
MIVVENIMKRENVGDTDCHYFYRVIKDKICLDKECITSMQSYGIEIERQDYKEDILVNLERESISNISPHRHKVQKLVNTLYNGNVSPIHLIDIVSEKIDEYIEDFETVLNEISVN